MVIFLGVLFMFVVYLYDLKSKSKLEFNRAKRVFYYHLGKLGLKKEVWKSKSVIAVSPDSEVKMDKFFKKFRKFLVVYKLHTDSIEQL